MHSFLANNRNELAQRCRIKVAARSCRHATAPQLQNDIPLFLNQLSRTLEIEQTSSPLDSRRVFGPAGGSAALSEVSVSAAQHGRDLPALGLSVDQVVHDYGNLCQAMTDLAVERDAPFEVDEFRTLNRCLDNAISDAVTEFSFRKQALTRDANAGASRQLMGNFAHELRNLLGSAALAFAAAKAGNLSLTGATGAILKRSLQGLEKLIAASLEDVCAMGETELVLASFSPGDFIAEVFHAALLSAAKHGCTLREPVVDPELALVGTRDPLRAAVANLLQNAFEFARTGTEILLTAYANSDKIHIDVQDHCGGLGEGVAQSMFLPFAQSGIDQSGMGLGLTIPSQSVTVNKGKLTVQNLPGKGCVFTITLPRNKMPI